MSTNYQLRGEDLFLKDVLDGVADGTLTRCHGGDLNHLCVRVADAPDAGNWVCLYFDPLPVRDPALTPIDGATTYGGNSADALQVWLAARGTDLISENDEAYYED